MSKKSKKGELGSVVKKKNKWLAKYENIPAKGSVMNSAGKALLETLGATIGAGISATAGATIGIPSGFILLAVGNYLDDKSGILRVIGSGAVAYGIAKVLEEKVSINGLGEVDKAKERLTKFKDEVLVAFYIDKLLPAKETKTGVSGFEEEEQVGRIDLSALDMYEDYNEQQALKFNQMNGTQSVDFAYSVFEDNPDY